MTVEDIVKALQAGEVLLTDLLDAIVGLLKTRSRAVDEAVRAIDTAVDIAEDAKVGPRP
jgi:hypothetical protein